jgi:hypothetical protein
MRKINGGSREEGVEESGGEETEVRCMSGEVREESLGL